MRTTMRTRARISGAVLLVVVFASLRAWASTQHEVPAWTVDGGGGASSGGGFNAILDVGGSAVHGDAGYLEILVRTPSSAPASGAAYTTLLPRQTMTPGAILGKAMTAPESGRGLVLVPVTLQ